MQQQQQQQQLADFAYLIVRATDRPSLTMFRPTSHHTTLTIAAMQCRT